MKLTEIHLNDGTQGLPKNPRLIRDAKFAKLCESIRDNPEFMPARPIIVDEAGVILGGNMRYRACQSLGMTDLPDDWVQRVTGWTVEKKRRFIILDNRSYGEDDWDLLANEWEVGELVAAGLEEKELTGVEDDKGKQDVESQVDRGVFALREDAVFPASNKYGIPDLRDDMLANVPPPPSCWTGGEAKQEGLLMLYGSNAFPENVRNAVLAFYVDDYRFESVWNDAVSTIDRLRKYGFSAIVSPDFSVWRDDPVAVQIWNIYRARWVARYWQELGIKVVPSLNWSDEKSYEFSFCGLPTGAPVLSCQCRTTRSRKGKDFFLRGLSQGIEKLKPASVWIYGGNEHRADFEPSLPGGIKYSWLNSRTEVRRKEGLR